MKTTVLIVGNGLSIDLCNHLRVQLDPSHPFGCPVMTPGKPTRSFLADLPHLQNLINNRSGLNDFDVIGNFLSTLNNDCSQWDSSQTKTYCEIRHFLCVAYSWFQIQLDGHENASEWRWTKWISVNREELVGAFSFNYDLVLERTLARAAISFHRIGVGNKKHGMPIAKPHGSIDFETVGISVPVQYPLRMAIFLNDTPIKVIPSAAWLQPRVQPSLVLPAEASPQSTFQWVSPCWTWFHEQAPSFKRCVIVGLSYWPCDRSEIDFLVNQLPRDCQAYVVNPHPSQEFVELLRARVSHVCIGDGPPDW